MLGGCLGFLNHQQYDLVGGGGRVGGLGWVFAAVDDDM